MADSPAFTALAAELERCSNLDRLEARGTVRIALKAAGLEPSSVGKRELLVVVDKLLFAELDARGVNDSAHVCEQLLACLRAQPDGDEDEPARRPEEVFGRLGS